MGFYNILFATYNDLLKKLRQEDTELTSIVLVFACQTIHLIATLALLTKFTSLTLVRFSSKYYLLIFLIPWLALEFSYYSKQTRARILEEFNQMPNKKKKTWAVISLIAFAVPLIAIPILFT